MRPWVFVKPLIDGGRKDSLLAVTMLRHEYLPRNGVSATGILGFKET